MLENTSYSASVQFKNTTVNTYKLNSSACIDVVSDLAKLMKETMPFVVRFLAQI